MRKAVRLFIFGIMISILAAVECMPARAQAESTKISKSARSSVQSTKMRELWSTGLILGRPIRRAPNDGIIWPDYIQIIVGNFQDNLRYLGHAYIISTNNREIFNQVEKLDAKKQYVFHYYQRFLLTEAVIDGVEPATNLAEFIKAGLPLRIGRANSKAGREVDPAVSTGRIVRVYRRKSYISKRSLCFFVLDEMGAHQGILTSSGKQKTFQVESEYVCRYAGEILPYALDVKVTYTVAQLIVGSRNIASSIAVDKISSVEPVLNDHPAQ